MVAAADSVDVHIEIRSSDFKADSDRAGLQAEVKTTDLLKECTAEEARQLAAEDLKEEPSAIKEECVTKEFLCIWYRQKGVRFVFWIKKDLSKCREMMEKALLCKKLPECGLSDVGRTGDLSAGCHPAPGLLCFAPEPGDGFSGSVDLDKIMMLMEVEMQMINHLMM